MIALFVVGITFRGADAALIAYEGFNYDGPTIDGEAGGTGWTAAWADGDSDFEKVQSGSLGSAAFPFTPIGNRVEGNGVVAIAAEADRDLPVELDFGVDGTTFYASFLVKKTSAPGGSQNNVEFQLNAAGSARLRLGSTSSSRFFLNSTAAADLGPDFTQNETFFVVLKGVSSAAGSDQLFAKIYDSLDSPPTTEPVTWDMINHQNWSDKLNRIRLIIGTNAGAAFDEIRIGSTWDSVTAPVPEPASIILCAMVVSSIVSSRSLRLYLVR